MSIAKVTPELSILLKELRKLTNVTSKEIADFLNKSTGFVSNLENCKTPTIDSKIVFDILNFLQKRSEDTDNTLNVSSRIEKFLNEDLKLSFSQSELEKQEKEETFYIQFDKQYRIIRIDSKLIEYLKNEISELGVSAVDVIMELNSNQSIPNEYKDIEPNVLVVSFPTDQVQEVIRFDLKEDFLDNILSRNIKRTNYITLQGIVYALNLLKGMSDTEAIEKAGQELYKHKIYTLDERNQIAKAEKTGEIIAGLKNADNVNSNLPENEIRFYNVLRELVKAFDKLKDSNVDYMLAILTNLINNLRNRKTRNMMLALLTIPLKSVEDIPEEKQREIYKGLVKYIEEEATQNEIKDEDLKIIRFDE
jgi:vacuolar-type H+-ATPase subunit F/Vma7